MNTLPKTTVSGAESETGLIQQQIDQIRSALVTNQDAIEDLAVKLGPVMEPERPEPCLDEAEDRQPESPVLQNLRRIEGELITQNVS